MAEGVGESRPFFRWVAVAIRQGRKSGSRTTPERQPHRSLKIAAATMKLLHSQFTVTFQRKRSEALKVFNLDRIQHRAPFLFHQANAALARQRQ